MLEETDALAEERLVEHTHRAIFRPQTVTELTDALVAHRLLHSLRRVLEKLDYHLTFRDTSAAVKKPSAPVPATVLFTMWVISTR